MASSIIKTTGGKAGSVVTHKNSTGKAMSNAAKKTVHGSTHVAEATAHGSNNTSGAKGMHLRHTA
jgi:hypothetical protein